MFKRESKSVKHRQWSVHQDWQSLPRMCHFKTNDGTVRTHSAARAVITGRNTDCSILFGDNKRERKGRDLEDMKTHSLHQCHRFMIKCDLGE